MRRKGGAGIVTIKDVARLSGVSIATVSRVLNCEENVAPETRERVQAAIEKLNYSPNLLGRNLRRGATKNILVLLNTISNPFYSRVVRGIEECLAPEGYSVTLLMTHGDVQLEQRAVRLLQTRRVDGAIFLSVEQPGPQLSDLCREIPVVQACEPQKNFLAASVCIDNYSAARNATEYLIRKGHRDIVFFGASAPPTSAEDRAAGYREAVLQVGCCAPRVIEEGYSTHAGMRAAKKLLESGAPLPDAVFCISDSVAIGAIRVFSEAGIRVPEQISVMGFDDSFVSEVFVPSITTIRQPRYEIGHKAAELLLQAIHNEDNRMVREILAHELIERESVAVRENK